MVAEIIKAVCRLSVVRDYALFRKYNLREMVKSAKDPPQLNSEQAAQAGNREETNLEAGDRSNQNDQAEGKSNQQVVPENSEELRQTKPVSKTQVANERGAKPELASQVTEGSESNENDFS